MWATREYFSTQYCIILTHLWLIERRLLVLPVMPHFSSLRFQKINGEGTIQKNASSGINSVVLVMWPQVRGDEKLVYVTYRYNDNYPIAIAQPNLYLLFSNHAWVSFQGFSESYNAFEVPEGSGTYVQDNYSLIIVLSPERHFIMGKWRLN